MNEQALHNLSYGLFVLTSQDYGKDCGCIVNTVIQSASNPTKLSVAINKGNFTTQAILSSKKFVASVISEDCTFELFKHFGFQSSRSIDKFKEFTSCERTQNGLYYITKGTNSYMSVNVTDVTDLGSHYMFSGVVEDMEVLSDKPSATYGYYHKNIKPQPQAQKSAETIWRCVICNYEYKGDPIPADFICPWCKHPVSDFVRVEG